MKRQHAAVTSLPKFRLIFLLGVFCFSMGNLACSKDDDYEVYATLRGTVTDYATGAPLANASVVLSPSGLTQQTGEDGSFLFEELDAEQYTVTVQKNGYQANRKTITAVSGEEMEINIQLTVIEEE